MRMRALLLVALIICASAFASVAVEFSSRIDQKSVRVSRYQSSVQAEHKVTIQLLGEEIDTPGIPR